MRRNLIYSLGLICSIEVATAANSGSTSIPAAATASAVQQELQAPESVLPTKLKKSPLTVKNASIAPPPEVSGPGTFILRRVSLVGSKLSIPIEAQNVIKVYEGRRVNLQTLKLLQQQLENAYRDAGYVLNQVTLPPQKIDPNNANVIFQVTDGHISRVEFIGKKVGTANNQLQRYLDQITAMRPFNFKTAERYLLLANDIPGMQLKGTLRADPAQPGTSMMVVSTETTRFQGMVNYNNRGTQYIGPNQVLAQVQANQIVGADSLQLNLGTVEPYAQEMLYFYGLYNIQVGKEGTQLTASYTDTQTRPGGSFSSTGLSGELQQVLMGVSQPLLRSLAQNVWFLSNLYHTHNQSNYSTGPAFNDQITGLQAGLNYQGILWGGGNNVQLMGTQGLPFNGTRSSDPSRNNAVENFTKFTLLASHIHYLTQKVSFVLAGNGQASGQSLPVSEQIGYGGSLFGLAYQPSQITGDQGIIGSTSLRYDLPSIWHFQVLQPFITYDIGQVYVHSPAAGESSSSTGASFAVGLNLGLREGLQGSLMMAKPLTMTPSNSTNKNWQGFFNLSWVF